MKCDYGCGGEAVYTFKNGKKCCRKSGAWCIGTRQKAIISFKVTNNQIDPETGLTRSQIRGQEIKKTRSKKDKNGQTSYEKSAKKAAKTKRDTIDENSGLTLQQLNSLAVADAKRNNIDSNGRNSFDRAMIKAVETKRKNIDENGNDSFVRAGLKAGKTKRNIILEDGSTLQEKISRKVRDSLLTKIDENGLNGYQQIASNMGRACSYKNTSIYIQSKNEEKFLDKLLQEKYFTLDNLEHNVQRGPLIEYIDENGKNRIYEPDFLIDGIIYEIKSNYTWFNPFNKEYMEYRNTLKLNAALEKGYKVILVLDNKELKWPTKIEGK